MPIAIVTDSTCDLPAELVQQMGIHVVPCTINFADHSYRDGVDITHDEFYRFLTTSPTLPTTSAPPIGEFLKVYGPLVEANTEVVSIHVSAKLSATLDSALQAKSSLGNHNPISVVDSHNVSMGLGLLVLEAAQLAQAGAGSQDIVDQINISHEKTSVFCMLDTLEYVRRGGRIGAAAAFLATTIGVKPIITLRDGETHPVSRPRTRKKAINKLVEVVEEQAPLKSVCVIHSTSDQDAETLRLRLTDLTQAEVISVRFGSVVGAHAGPGALGIAMTRD